MKMVKKRRAVQTVIWLALILIAWEAASRTGFVNAYILPPFSEVVAAMFQQLFSGKLGVQALNSVLLILEGFAISIVIAIVITVLCTWSPLLETFFTTLCVICNPLPGIALLPLIMMWFGINTGAMLALIVHGVLWPLVSSLLAGFKAVPGMYREWGENIGVSPFRMVTDIYIFCVMPYLIDGLRTGWARSWRALISAEMLFGMIGSLGGIGYYIFTNRAYSNIRNVMAGILVIVIIGVTVEVFLFRVLEKRTVQKWGMSHV